MSRSIGRSPMLAAAWASFRREAAGGRSPNTGSRMRRPARRQSAPGGRATVLRTSQGLSQTALSSLIWTPSPAATAGGISRRSRASRLTSWRRRFRPRPPAACISISTPATGGCASLAERYPAIPASIRASAARATPSCPPVAMAARGSSRCRRRSPWRRHGFPRRETGVLRQSGRTPQPSRPLSRAPSRPVRR
jgi:hypothetical protein